MTTTAAHPIPAQETGRSLALATALPLFVAALFLSAFLLFAVQPMFAKMTLPVLGGSPAVWSVALVFFQALLLAGYCYAHLLARLASTRAALAVHLAVILAASSCLPIALAEGWTRAPAEGEAFWLLGLFTVSVALPFFAVAANGPLLQAWFARSGHPRAADPYFLYAASNVGSFSALVVYPLAAEPFLKLQAQAAAWFAGFAALAVLIGACGLAGGAGAQPLRAPPADEAAAPPSVWRDRAAWVALAFVPSGLLMSVTAHISTDIAAAPLLWVVPLALYLLTFILAFRDRTPAAVGTLARLQVWGTAFALMDVVAGWGLWIGLSLHLGLFLVNAMACHAALYRRRPAASRLTEFYVCLSFGGVLGGIACGLAAPHVFSRVVEYPLLIIAALACRPGFFGGTLRTWAREAGLAALACLVAVAAVRLVGGAVLPADELGPALAIVTAALLMVAWRNPRQVAPAALAALLASSLLGDLGRGEAVRSFFGVHKITTSPDGRFRLLAHGTTIHGAMRIANEDGTVAAGRPEPTAYYTYEGAIGSALASIREARGGRLGAVAVIGLGTGSLACHIAPGEAWTFLEIDRAVLRIAGDPRWFRFLSECAPGVPPVVLGDARVTLAGEPGGKGLIVVDAFSSDAIPAHLVTREAIGLYLSKLDETGAVVAHISNRHLDLSRILARAGAEYGLSTYLLKEGEEEPRDRRFRAPATVAALARDPAHLGRIVTDGVWRPVAPDMAREPWTDDFSNIVQAILDKHRP